MCVSELTHSTNEVKLRYKGVKSHDSLDRVKCET